LSPLFHHFNVLPVTVVPSHVIESPCPCTSFHHGSATPQTALLCSLSFAHCPQISIPAALTT
jgi:hypothetical protein